jgi:hypothetical protein
MDLDREKWFDWRFFQQLSPQDLAKSRVNVRDQSRSGWQKKAC